MNSLHRLSNCEINGLEFHGITTEYRTRVHCIHMLRLLCNALVLVIYSGVSGQCSHTILCLIRVIVELFTFVDSTSKFPWAIHVCILFYFGNQRTFSVGNI